MKILNTIMFSLILFGSMSACTFTKQDNSNKQGKEYTSAYVCPMHCEGSGSDSVGQCPVCGMDYIKNEEEQHKNNKK